MLLQGYIVCRVHWLFSFCTIVQFHILLQSHSLSTGPCRLLLTKFLIFVFSSILIFFVVLRSNSNLFGSFSSLFRTCTNLFNSNISSNILSSCTFIFGTSTQLLCIKPYDICCTIIIGAHVNLFCTVSGILPTCTIPNIFYTNVIVFRTGTNLFGSITNSVQCSYTD